MTLELSIEHKKAYNRKYNKEHKGKIKEIQDRWRKRNPERVKAYQKIYRLEHPEKVKEHYKKRDAKRRELGFNAINSAFDGCEGHHITKDIVIYIPKELHRSVYHNLWTGFNMDKINDLVVAWYIGDNLGKENESE